MTKILKKNTFIILKKKANKFIHYSIFPTSSIVLFNQYPSICELKGILHKVHFKEFDYWEDVV